MGMGFKTWGSSIFFFHNVFYPMAVKFPDFVAANVIYLGPPLPFPKQSLVLHVCSMSLLKTLLEKEKLLVKSSFSFSHSVFYPFGELSAIFIKVKIIVYKSFSLEE